MNQDNMKIWSVVSIKPNQMSKAEANLRNQNFTYLAPKIEISKRQQNRFISKTELLFPGYIFVLIDADGGDPGEEAEPLLQCARGHVGAPQ